MRSLCEFGSFRVTHSQIFLQKKNEMSVSCGAINGLVAAFSFTLDLDLKGVLNSSGRLVPIFNRKDTKSNHFLLLFFDFI